MRSPAALAAFALLLGAAAGLLPARAAAQGLPREDVTAIDLSLDVRHDSNVVRSNIERANARGLVRSDQRATPSIDFILARPLGRNRVQLVASAGYDFYRRNSRLNRERLSLVGDGTVIAGPLTIDGSAALARRQTDPAELTPLLLPGIESIRNTQTTQDYNLRARLGSSRYGLKPVASVGYGTGTNSAPLRRIADYRLFRYGGGVSYESPALGYVDLQYLRADIDYPNRPALLGQSGFGTERIQLTARRDLGAVLVAQGSLSWITLTPDQRAAGVRSFDGIGYSLALTAIPRPDLRVTASVARDVTPSLGTDALYQVGNSYAVTGVYQLSRDTYVSLSGAIDDRRFEGAGRVFGVALTDSVQRTISAGVGLAQSRRLRVAIDAGYTERDANGSAFDFGSFFVGARTSYRLGR